MFWKKRTRQTNSNVNNVDASQIVSQVSGVYADLNDQDKLIKPQSKLPCSWFAARECFMIAYDAEYHQLPDNVCDFYQHVYGELAFFVDDDLCNDFNTSLDIAVKCRVERSRKLGLKEDEAFCRRFIASFTVKIQSRKEIWENLRHEETCPRSHLLLLAETLSYCGELYRTMFDEWAAFANLVAYLKNRHHGL